MISLDGGDLVLVEIPYETLASVYRVLSQMDLGALVVRLDLPRGKRDPVNLTCPRVLSGAEIGPQIGSLLGLSFLL